MRRWLERVRSALGASFDLRKSNSRPYDYRVVMSAGNALRYAKRKATIRDNALVGHIEKLGLLGRPAQAKFVPDLYKHGSVEQRFALLRGLIDSDGTVTTTGSVSFSTTSIQLARDVQELVWSLGGLARSRRERTELHLPRRATRGPDFLHGRDPAPGAGPNSVAGPQAG